MKKTQKIAKGAYDDGLDIAITIVAIAVDVSVSKVRLFCSIEQIMKMFKITF